MVVKRLENTEDVLVSFYVYVQQIITFEKKQECVLNIIDSPSIARKVERNM